MVLPAVRRWDGRDLREEPEGWPLPPAGTDEGGAPLSKVLPAEGGERGEVGVLWVLAEGWELGRELLKEEGVWFTL